MSLLWQDGDFTTASAVSPLKPSSATPDGKYNVIAQDFVQTMTSFAALAIGTAHPTQANYYLVEETAPQPIGCGVGRWTRVYAKVPETHSEYQSYGFNWIGFAGVFGANVETVSGREREVKDVMSRIQYDYYLVGTPTYPTPDDIPLIDEQKYYVSAVAQSVEYIFDGSPSSTPSLTAYLALVAAGSEIVAVASEAERWKGNIYVRKTRYVTAI